MHQVPAPRPGPMLAWQPTFPSTGPPLTAPEADLLPDVGAEGHVRVQLAVVEQVCLLQLSPQGTALDQVDVRDVGHIPDATEGDRGRWRGLQAGGEGCRLRVRDQGKGTIVLI